MLQCDLHDLGTKQEYLDAIAAYASSNPDEEWILGGGWSQDVFPRGCPPKEDLDAIVPDRAVYLPNRDGHSVWVNAKALELAGIDASTPDPDDGRIERLPDGSPQGTLHEGAASIVSRIIPPLDQEMVYQGLLKGQAYLHSLGLTGWQDAIVDRSLVLDNYDAYLRAGGNGDLTGRVVGALWWDRSKGLEQIDDLVHLREGGTAGRFRADQREDHAGRRLRELHRGRARALPRRARRADRQPRDLVRRPVGPRRGRDPARRAGVPGALPRAGGAGGARGARRDRGGAPDERLERWPAPPGPHPGRAPRRHPEVP